MLKRRELTVVILVVAIVLALVLPAVEKVRRAAARTQSNNNLKRCAFAIQNYHDTFRTLPSAYDFGGLYPATDAGNRRSLWFHILPYVESDKIYKSQDAAVQQASVIPAFQAPADLFNREPAGKVSFGANIRVFATRTTTVVGEVVNAPDWTALQNINAMLGDDSMAGSGGTLAMELPGNNTTTVQANMRLQMIPDGTTNVIMLVTKYAMCDGAAHTAYYAAPGESFVPSGLKGTHTGGFALGGTHKTAPTEGGPSTDAMFQILPNGDQTDNTKNCVNAAGGANVIYGHAFSPGGMSVAMCDGSVWNIQPTVSIATFARVICPGDGFPARGWDDGEP